MIKRLQILLVGPPGASSQELHGRLKTPECPPLKYIPLTCPQETWAEQDLICEEYQSCCICGSMPGPVPAQEKQVLAPRGSGLPGRGGRTELEHTNKH